MKFAAPKLVRSALVRRPSQAVEEGQTGDGPSAVTAGRFEPLGDEHASQMVLELDALRDEELTEVQKRAALARRRLRQFDRRQFALHILRQG